MNETGGQAVKRVLIGSNDGATMSCAEKASFWVWPFMLAFLSLPFILTSAIDILFLVAKARGLVVKDSGSNKYELIGALVMWISPLLAATLLYFSFSVFSRMIRRKRKTGSLLPAGEELNDCRIRRRLRSRILVPAFFCYFAFGFTFRAISYHDFRASACALLIVMWLIAISITVVASRSTEPRWLAVVVTALFYLAATSSTSLTFYPLTSGDDRGHWSIFSALMWTIAAISTADIFRSRAPKCPPPDASEEARMPRGDEGRRS
jgi:hypothetical protein